MATNILSTTGQTISFSINAKRNLEIHPVIPTLVDDIELALLKTRLGHQIKVSDGHVAEVKTETVIQENSEVKVPEVTEEETEVKDPVEPEDDTL